MTLEVEAPVVAHPVPVLAVLAQADAEEDIVGVVIFGLEEVRIVGRDDRKPEVGGEGEDALVELLLPFAAVRLDLEEVPPGKMFGVPGRCFPGRVVMVDQQVGSEFAGHAGRRNDQPLAVLFEQFPVDSRSRIEAFGIAE